MNKTKSTIKRITSLFLSLVFVISAFCAVDFSAQAKIMNWTPICSSDFTGDVDGNGQYPTYNSQGSQMGWDSSNGYLYMNKYNNQNSTFPMSNMYSWKIDVGFKLTGNDSNAVTALKQYAFMRLGIYKAGFTDQCDGSGSEMTGYTYYCQDAHGYIYSWENNNYGGTDSDKTSISVNNPYLRSGVNYHYIAEFDYERLYVYIADEAGNVVCQIAAVSTPSTFISRLTNIHDNTLSNIVLGSPGGSNAALPGIEYKSFALYSGEETHVTDTSGKYLFAYFTGNGNSEQQVRFALSEDGRNYTPINGNDAIPSLIAEDTDGDGTHSSGCTRDPYLYRKQDGSGYYLVATDMDASGIHSSWAGDTNMYVFESDDLVNWEQIADWDVTTTDAFVRGKNDNTPLGESAKITIDGTEFDLATTFRMWAPQFMWDAQEQAYMVYWANYMCPTGTDTKYWDSPHLYCYTTDFQHYYGLGCLFKNGNTATIDGDIVYNTKNSTYYMYYKNEGTGSIRYATSSVMHGPYADKGSVLSADDWQNITGCTDGQKALEGSACYFIGDELYMMIDNYATQTMIMLKSDDFENFHLLNDADYDTHSFGISRHASVIQISDAEYNALVAAYADKDYSFHEDFSVGKNGWAGWHWDPVTRAYYSAKTANQDNASIYTFANSNYISIYKGCLFVEDWTVRRIMAGHKWTASLEAIVTTKSSTPTPIICLTSGTAENNNKDWFRILDSGTIQVYDGSAYQTIGTTTIEEAVEYTFHVTYDDTTLKVYKNGELVCQTAWNNGYDATAANNYVGIGFSDQTNSNSDYFRGTISDLRFKMGAKTAAQISAEYSENLMFQKTGNDTCDDLPNSIDGTTPFYTTDEYSGSLSSSITVAAWVNPGTKSGEAKGMLCFGDGGGYENGQYFVLAENGDLYYQWGDGTNQHYVTVNGVGSFATNTWSFVQINIIPYRNSVRIKTWQDGVATTNTYCTDTGTNMTGFDNLPINFFSQDSLKVTYGSSSSYWWWNDASESDDGTVYLNDIRVYGKALHNVYDEAKEAFENNIAKNYVEENLATYSVTDTKNKATRAAYHYGNTATNGYNNVLACSTSTVCANDYYDRNWGLYKFFWPADIALMYDGVNTPALPVTFESKEHSGSGHPSQKQLYTIFSTTANFSNAHYWTGYIDADTVANPWTVWPESYRPYNYDDGLMNSNNSLADYSYIGWGDGAEYDYYYYYNNTNNPRWFWNKVNYTGNMSNNTVYKEKYTSIAYRIWDGSGQDIPGNSAGETHNIYIINYKPIYDILNGTTTITHGSGTYTLKELYAHVHANETMYTENSVNDFYKAAYEVLTANPNRISEGAYQANFEDKVDAAAEKIEDAVTAFNNISLKTRADFTDLDTKYNNAVNIVNTLNTDSQRYTTSTIIALRDVIENLVYEPNDGDPYRPNVEAFASSSAILAEKDAIDDAVAALDTIYNFDSHYAAYNFPADYDNYKNYNQIWQYSTDILDTKGTDAQAYTTTTIEALGTVINNCYYAPVLNRVPDRKDIGVNADGAAIAAEVNAMDNAISYLAAVANFSALDTAYAQGDSILKDLSDEAPLYTKSSVDALITAVSNASADAHMEAATRRDTGALYNGKQTSIDGEVSAINTAIANLETSKPAEVTDLSTYRAAAEKIRHVDPDIYDTSSFSYELALVSASGVLSDTDSTYTDASSTDYTIKTVDTSINQDDVDEAVTGILGYLTTNLKTYTITLDANGRYSTERDAVTAETPGRVDGSGRNWTGYANTKAVITAADDNTAWYATYKKGETVTRARRYQGYGESITLNVLADMEIEAVQATDAKPNKVTINRNFSDNDTTHGINSIDFAGSSYTLPAAHAIAYYRFDGYSFGDHDGTSNPYYQAGDTISVTNKNTIVKAMYTKVADNEYTVKVSTVSGNGDVFDDSASYNTKITASDDSAYAWVETPDGGSARIFHIGSDLTFFVTDSVEVKAITKAQYDAAGYVVPKVNLRASGFVQTAADNGKKKLTFNGQVVHNNAYIVECGILVGKATTGSITNDDMVLANTGAQDGYKILRAKSTQQVGANQFTIGVTTNLSGDFKYRGYAVYQVGSDIITVYSDVVDATIS